MRALCLCLGWVAAGCATVAPPRELVEARAAYHRAQRGPAAERAPAELYRARQALGAAEAAFQEAPGSVGARDRAYLALRRVERAEALAELHAARGLREAAERELWAEPAMNAAQVRAQVAAVRTAVGEAGQVELAPRGVVVSLESRRLFAPGAARLTAEGKARLARVAEVAALKPLAALTVEGHTAATEDRSRGQLLALRQAQAVVDFMVSHGVEPGRVHAVGVGSDRPLADNRTEEGRAHNQRVEVVLERGSVLSSHATREE